MPNIARPFGADSCGKVQLLAAVADVGANRAKDPTAATARTDGRVKRPDIARSKAFVPQP
jgi:hypothetical protein